jgi:hypothetical protein
MNRRSLIVAAALVAAPALARAAPLLALVGGESFIQLETLTATVTRPGGGRGVMTVEVGVDVPDTALHARAAQSTPRLQAAYSEVLRIYAGGLPPGSLPNADYLGQALQRATDQTLGRPGARLLLGAILVN